MTRQESIERRKHIQNRPEKEAALRKNVAPFLSGIVAGYMAVKGEADIHAPDQYLPRCGPDCTLQFGKGRLEKNTWGLQEPTENFIDKDAIDVFLVPMTAFCGPHRKGYGKGYYDRYLKDARGLKIGIAFDEQEDTFEPAPWDVAMDMVITPTRILDFRYNERDMDGR